MPTMEPGAPDPVDLADLFTSDDVRGAVPDPLSPQVAAAVAAAFATVVVLPESGDDQTPAELDGPVDADAQAIPTDIAATTATRPGRRTACRTASG